MKRTSSFPWRHLLSTLLVIVVWGALIGGGVLPACRKGNEAMALSNDGEFDRGMKLAYTRRNPTRAGTVRFVDCDTGALFFPFGSTYD